jgi:hypothetical protein
MQCKYECAWTWRGERVGRTTSGMVQWISQLESIITPLLKMSLPERPDRSEAHGLLSFNSIDTYCTRPIPFSASSRPHCLKMCFCTFPLAVFGSSFRVPSSPMNQTHAGAFYVESYSRSLDRQEYAPAGSCSPTLSSLRSLGTT